MSKFKMGTLFYFVSTILFKRNYLVNKDHIIVIKRIEALEKVVEDLKKFRWQFGAILAAVLIGANLIPVMKTLLTPASAPATIERTK